MTAYHPQSNGMMERFHQQLKASLMARLTGPGWSQQFPWVLLGIQAAHKADMGASPAKMVYGTKLHIDDVVVQETRSSPFGNFSEVITKYENAKNIICYYQAFSMTITIYVISIIPNCNWIGNINLIMIESSILSWCFNGPMLWTVKLAAWSSWNLFQCNFCFSLVCSACSSKATISHEIFFTCSH